MKYLKLKKNLTIHIIHLFQIKMIKKFKDVEAQIESLKKGGTPKGELTGFSNFDKHFTVKQGSYTFILGAPHQGKSELSFEIGLNQILRYHKKVMISSSETGSVADIYAELIQKISGRSIFNDSGVMINESDFYKTVNFIDEWFSIVDTDDTTYSFQELFGMRTNEHIIIADPYNEHKHDMVAYGSRQDLYIEDLMGEVRRLNKKANTHMIITLHPASQQIKEAKINGNSVSYYPMPLAREAAGGQALFRKAMTWINVWRPPVGLKGYHGQFYKANEMVYMVEKSKPKGVANKGMGSLFYDFQRNRYYEMIGDLKCYAFQHEKIIINTEGTQEIPF